MKVSLIPFRADEAYEIGQSVVMNGTYDECLEAAKKLAPLGFVCSLVALPPNDVGNDAARISVCRTRAANLCTASEVIAFLRSLATAPAWRPTIVRAVTDALLFLPSLLDAPQVAATSPKMCQVSSRRENQRCGRRSLVLTVCRLWLPLPSPGRSTSLFASEVRSA